MRTFLRIVGGILLLLLLAVGGVGGLYLSAREPIPALESDTVADSWADTDVPADLIARAQARLTALRREIGYPSVSVAVAVDGQLVWSEAQGFAVLEADARATRETVYAVGSVSKALTAAGAMRLAERGVLDLDADVRKYVPWFPEKTFPVTARQLLSHQAGIRHYGFDFNWTFSEFGSNVQYNNVRDSIAIFANDPLLFEPDTAFAYSSYGFNLLSAVMEGAAGQPFLEVMQAEVFGPQGMTHTGGDDKLHPVAGRAGDYQNIFRDGHVVPAPSTNSSNKWAGGGFRSTPSDLAMFGSALIEGKIVSSETFAVMATPRTLKNGRVNAQDYGLGFRIDTLSDPAYPGKSFRAVHHGGVAVGQQAMLVLLPDQRVAIALSANATTQPPGRGMFDAATDIAILFAAAPH